MTEKKRFRMEIIEGASLPFIVDNDSAKKQSDKITSYHTYETDKKNKCLELVELLNTLHEENEQLSDFKSKTFNSIDGKIERGEQAIEWGESVGADVGAMGFHIEMLKMLKKELFE